MVALIRKHAAASYFVLTFLLSWGGILAVIGGGPIPASPEEAQRLFLPVYLAMLAGPSIAGITITAITGGTSGLREYRDRLLKWRVASPWYTIALLTAPLTLLTTILLLSWVSTDFVPSILNGKAGGTGPVQAASRAAFLVMAVLVGIGAGFFEELGWTGVAMPALRARHGAVMTGLLVGLAWGAWHFLAILWGGASAVGTVPVTVYLMVALFSFLPPYRILMMWVYDRTRSTLVNILMHASLTASMLILGPAIMGGELLTYDLVFAALLWTIVGIVVWNLGGDTSAIHVGVPPARERVHEAHDRIRAP